jgi:hypothetical protein
VFKDGLFSYLAMRGIPNGFLVLNENDLRRLMNDPNIVSDMKGNRSRFNHLYKSSGDTLILKVFKGLIKCLPGIGADRSGGAVLK